MKDLTIIAWLIMFPFITTLTKFLSLKIGEIINREYNERHYNITTLIEASVFIVVLIYLNT